jgi:hypothetical protein
MAWHLPGATGIVIRWMIALISEADITPVQLNPGQQRQQMHQEPQRLLEMRRARNLHISEKKCHERRRQNHEFAHFKGSLTIANIHIKQKPAIATKDNV